MRFSKATLGMSIEDKQVKDYDNGLYEYVGDNNYSGCIVLINGFDPIKVATAVDGEVYWWHARTPIKLRKLDPKEVVTISND
jgi:hypothetical protein